MFSFYVHSVNAYSIHVWKNIIIIIVKKRENGRRGKRRRESSSIILDLLFFSILFKNEKKRNLTKTWSMKLIHFGESISNFPFFSLHFVITNIGDILFLWILYSIFFSHRILFVRLNKKKNDTKMIEINLFFLFHIHGWLVAINTNKKKMDRKMRNNHFSIRGRQKIFGTLVYQFFSLFIQSIPFFARIGFFWWIRLNSWCCLCCCCQLLLVAISNFFFGELYHHHYQITIIHDSDHLL